MLSNVIPAGSGANRTIRPEVSVDVRDFEDPTDTSFHSGPGLIILAKETIDYEQQIWL